jgi:methanogenic corrinoid protein MtbC1
MARATWTSADQLGAENARPARLVRSQGEDRGEWLTRLVHAIETEVVPRLVLSGRAGQGTIETRHGVTIPSGDEVATFSELVLYRNEQEVDRFVDRMRYRGLSVEMLYLDLLTPTARRLGELWKEDLCDFAQVTLGLGRLHELLRSLSNAFQTEADPRPRGLRALLVPVPGEQHSFGLAMVAEFFRRAGWDVWSGPMQSVSELCSVIRSNYFSVVGLSVSCGTCFDNVAASVRAARRASRNRGIGVMVGGQIFVEHPELVAVVGADATAFNGRDAVLQAHHLIELLARQR